MAVALLDGMSSRTRNAVIAGVALFSLVALAMIPLFSRRGPTPPPANLPASSDVSDVSVREGDAPKHGAKPAKNAAPSRAADPRRDASSPEKSTPRFDQEPAVEANAAAGNKGIVLASVTDPRTRMMIAPEEAARLSIGLPSTTQGSAPAALAAATPVPTPAFCPIGAALKQAKGSFGREKWCVREDRGGIEIKDGPYVAWWTDGKKRAEGNYAGGKQHGEWIEWYSTGLRAAEGDYRNGRRDGPWAFWRESGKKAEEGSFRNGEKQGHWVVFDDAGHRSAEGEIRTSAQLSRENGKWTYFWPNGTKREEGSFREGKRDGKWTAYDAAGKVVAVNSFHDGEKE